MIDESPHPEKMESPKTQTVGQESIAPFPIEVFLDRLTRQHGWDVSVRDRLRIARVLRADGAWTTARLQQVLGSLLARSLDEHQAFENYFRAFFGPPTGAEPLPVLPWDRDRIHAEFGRLVEPVAPADTSSPVAQQRPSSQAGMDATARPPAARWRLVETGWPASVAQNDESPRPPKRLPRDGAGPAVPSDLAAPAGPRLFFLSDVAEPGPMLDVELLDHLADSMGYFPSHLPSRQLDLVTTVERTIANRCPTLCFLPGREVCHLLILEDLYAQDRAWNRVAGEFAVGMSQRGIPVTCGIFYGNPMRFRRADGSGGCDLEDWEDLRDGVLALLFTDGTGLSATEAPRVLDELQQWPRLAWMDLRDEPFWDGATLRAVRLRMSVFPASAEGMLRMSQAFFTEQGRTVTRRRLPLPVDPHAPLEARLREILDVALPWAQTCSCLASIPMGLADALRRRFHFEIPATAIGRFHALLDKPDDTAGLRFPESVRAALFGGFCASRSDGQQAEVFEFIRTLIGAEIQKLAFGSLARQSGEALLMRLQLFEGQVPSVEVVDQLLGGRLGPAFRVGLGEDARLLRDAERLSAEQADPLHRRGLLPKVRIPYPPDMVRIPAGRFWMGDTTGEGWEDERPRHEVEVGEFFIGKHPVTWRLWRKVHAWAVERGYQFDNLGTGLADDHPVTSINWYDALKWCNARSEMERRRPVYYTAITQKEPYRQGRIEPVVAIGTLTNQVINACKTDRPLRPRLEHLAVAQTLASKFREVANSVEANRLSGYSEIMGTIANEVKGLLMSIRQEGRWAGFRRFVSDYAASVAQEGGPDSEYVNFLRLSAEALEIYAASTTYRTQPTNDGYRLPTEAEWEKAARGGLEGHNYPWDSLGENYRQLILPSHANYDESAEGQTTKVGSYPANGYNLYDMAGNVFQWVWDRWGRYDKSHVELSDARKPVDSVDRVCRGGSWWNSARNLRCASRSRWHPSDAITRIGFRLAGGQADAFFAELDEDGERGARGETRSEPPEESGARASCLTVELLPPESRTDLQSVPSGAGAKGSGVVFGQQSSDMVDHSPKTTPDPVVAGLRPSHGMHGQRALWVR